MTAATAAIASRHGSSAGYRRKEKRRAGNGARVSLGRMRTVTARDAAALSEVSGAVHDAYIDGDVEFDRDAGVAVLPIVQEGWADGPPPEREFVRETWRYRESRVTFFRGQLTIRRVVELREPEDWDAPMLYRVTFHPASQELHVHSSEPLRVEVEALDVTLEISSEVGGHVRRRIGKLSRIESHVWLDQLRPGARSRRLPL
jgi:hypothetical protein